MSYNIAGQPDFNAVLRQNAFVLPFFIKIPPFSLKVLFHCNDAMLHCNDAMLRCNDAMLRCNDAMLRCNDAMLRCNDAMLRCNDAMLRCNDAMPHCNNAKLLCNDAMPRCNDAMPRCNDAMPRCNDAMPRCNAVLPRIHVALSGIGAENGREHQFLSFYAKLDAVGIMPSWFCIIDRSSCLCQVLAAPMTNQRGGLKKRNQVRPAAFTLTSQDICGAGSRRLSIVAPFMPQTRRQFVRTLVVATQADALNCLIADCIVQGLWPLTKTMSNELFAAA